MMFPPFISRAASAERRSTNWTKPHPCAGSEKIKQAAMRANEEEGQHGGQRRGIRHGQQ